MVPNSQEALTLCGCSLNEFIWTWFGAIADESTKIQYKNKLNSNFCGVSAGPPPGGEF